jgi:hypothetical protein
MTRLLALVLLLAAAALAAGPAAASSRGRHCGLTPRIHGQRFDIFEAEGHAACRTVKPPMVRYLRTLTLHQPWFCTETHGRQFPWAAACAKGDVVVHAYAPS